MFAIPLILGDMLQQCYNLADTLIVGQFLGERALAAVGSSFTLMTFITSILLGLCMGSGALFSIRFGERDIFGMKKAMCASFVLICGLAVTLTVLSFSMIDVILAFLQVPPDAAPLMKEYLLVIFAGIFATFLYNYFACLLRAVGNSVVPLAFLAVSALLNIVLDVWFVAGLSRGVAGAAEATVISQYVSGIGLAAYTFWKFPHLKVGREHMRINTKTLGEITSFSLLTCVQQSVMNLGILMVQGLVNSFGTTVMAAFGAAVKIDAFAYMPVQDFGNAFSTFIAQNYGAKETERIKKGFKGAVIFAVVFSVLVSAAVYVFASPLMSMFISDEAGGKTEVVFQGVRYLRIEGAFYFGIGCLFLLYGLYRAVGRPGMSVVLTVISLGVRVVLAYVLSAVPAIGVVGIWWSVPIGWLLADAAGFGYYFLKRKNLFKMREDLQPEPEGACEG